MSGLTALEGTILLWIQGHLRGPLDGLVTFITHLGDSGLLWIALGILLLCFRRTRPGGVAVLLALLFGLLITNIASKNLVARVRPYELFPELHSLAGTMRDWSFPSGHACSSFAAATALARTLGKKYGGPALILAALISLSRLYVGVHYPTDVLCGAAIGALCGLAAAAIVPALWKKCARGRSDKIH